MFYLIMLGSISAIKTNYEKCGYSRLKRLFQKDINFRKYDEFVPNAKSQVVGNLPSEMIRYIVTNFPDKKADKIKQFQKTLGDVAVFVRESMQELKKERRIYHGLDELDDDEIVLFQSEMSKILKNGTFGILPQNSSADFKYIDRGAFGQVFKLSVKDENGRNLMPDSAMKIYYKINSPVVPHIQGNYAEANFITFIKRVLGHDMGKSQFAKHYISDMKNGYSLSEFLYWDGDYDFVGRDYKRYFRVDSNDALKSFIAGKIFDWGGFFKMADFTGDKITIRYLKKLYNHPNMTGSLFEQYEKILKNKKNPQKEKIKKALDLYYQGLGQIY